MRYLKYVALLAILALPAVYSQAQVAIGVRIGPDYGIYNPPPVCEYGYYPDYPFGCAPYGYWGPEWFVDGIFIGAGPWYHFYYSHPAYYRPFYVGRFGFHRDFDRFRDDRGFRAEERRFGGGDRGFHGGERFRGGDRGFRSESRGYFGGRGSEFRGGAGEGFHGRGGFRAGGESRGGRGGSNGGGREFHGGREGGHGGHERRR